jgi:hypothetical protein
MGKHTSSKKEETIKKEDMKVFAKKQFSALAKMHMSIPVERFYL